MEVKYIILEKNITYNDLSRERRNGYEYVNKEGQSLLRTFAEWKKKNLL